MREIAIISCAQLPSERVKPAADEAELVRPVVTEAMEKAGLKKGEQGFTCSGSCDYLIGRPFSFVSALDGIGPWPPVSESHVEMDGAWAMYEAYVHLLHGHVDTALVYCYGKSSAGPIPDVFAQQMDPYYVSPLGVDSISMAAIQAQAMLDRGLITEKEMAEVVVRNRKQAEGNDNAQLKGDFDAKKLLKSPYISSPLRKHDCPPLTDTAACVVLAAGDKAKELCERPAWIRGIDHRIDAHGLGLRDLTESASTRIAGEKAGVNKGKVDVAELHAPFSHQEKILKTALGLGDETVINPSGGALAANGIMSAGLIRMIEVAERIHKGEIDRGVAHATSGPCLQQNMVAVLEGN